MIIIIILCMAAAYYLGYRSGICHEKQVTLNKEWVGLQREIFPCNHVREVKSKEDLVTAVSQIAKDK